VARPEAASPRRAIVRGVGMARALIDGYGVGVAARVANTDDGIPGTVKNRDAVPLYIRDVDAVGFGIDGQLLRVQPYGQSRNFRSCSQIEDAKGFVAVVHHLEPARDRIDGQRAGDSAHRKSTDGMGLLVERDNLGACSVSEEKRAEV